MVLDTLFYYGSLILKNSDRAYKNGGGGGVVDQNLEGARLLRPRLDPPLLHALDYWWVHDGFAREFWFVKKHRKLTELTYPYNQVICYSQE